MSIVYKYNFSEYVELSALFIKQMMLNVN